MASTTFDATAWIWEQARNAAVAAFKAYTVNPYDTQYVWFRQGYVSAGGNKPQGSALAFPERIPIHLTIDENTRWIADRLMRVPCLPETDPVPYTDTCIEHGPGGTLRLPYQIRVF